MSRYLSALIILGIALASAQGAEDEFVLLTIGGDLIGPIEPIGERIGDAQHASRLISAYHQLLTAQAQIEVASLHEQMLELKPGFEVAYAAADSAEISHIMSEIDLRLAAIQEVHAREYTQDVIDLLTDAYQLILPTFGDEQ